MYKSIPKLYKYVSCMEMNKDILTFKNLNIVIQLIPRETVNDYLGPDRLSGPKSLDLNYCRQLTL